MRRFIATWTTFPPSDADADDGPDIMSAIYDSRSVAEFSAPYHAAQGPAPDRWQITEQRKKLGRSIIRPDQWVAVSTTTGPGGAP